MPQTLLFLIVMAAHKKKYIPKPRVDCLDKEINRLLLLLEKQNAQHRQLHYKFRQKYESLRKKFGVGKPLPET